MSPGFIPPHGGYKDLNSYSENWNRVFSKKAAYTNA